MQKSWKALAGLPSRQSTGPFLGMHFSSFQLGYLYHKTPKVVTCLAVNGAEALVDCSRPPLEGCVFARDFLKSKSGWNATFLAKSYYGNVEFNRISI